MSSTSASVCQHTSDTDFLVYILRRHRRRERHIVDRNIVGQSSSCQLEEKKTLQRFTLLASSFEICPCRRSWTGKVDLWLGGFGGLTAIWGQAQLRPARMAAAWTPPLQPVMNSYIPNGNYASRPGRDDIDLPMVYTVKRP